MERVPSDTDTDLLHDAVTPLVPPADDAPLSAEHDSGNGHGNGSGNGLQYDSWLHLVSPVWI